jgi:NAD(P)-dependent dehydrogenase (short-subunit alcohol dehydrogenase family)
VGSIRNVGVAALSKNLADELGPHGVNVNVVHPGVTATERTADLVAHNAQRRGVDTSVVRAEFDAGNSTGRLVTAEEVADVVVFLASPRSRAINGDSIAAGGGAPRAIHY